MHNTIKIIWSSKLVFMQHRAKIDFKTQQCLIQTAALQPIITIRIQTLTTCRTIPSKVRPLSKSKARITLATANKLWFQIRIRNMRMPPWTWVTATLVKKDWAITIRSKCTSYFRKSRISSLRAATTFRLSMKTSFRWRVASLALRARTWRGSLRNVTIILGSTPTQILYHTKVSSFDCAARALASSKGPSKRKAPTR